jgi:DNA-binding MarR family transcriptional regulator
MRYLPTGGEHILMAQYALALINWRWFPGCEIVRKRDEQLLIPPLLFGVYLAHRRGKKITKAEACDLMKVDRATTGPKFIRALEADGLVSIERHPEIDKRKAFLAPTKKLERLVERELVRLARNLACLAADLRHSDLTSAAQLEDATRTLSVGPSCDNLLPIDWPPDDVGASIK